MKKILLLLILSVVLCLPTSCDHSHAVDESETPLKFKILSDSTLEVINDNSYRELDSVSVPAKVRINGKIYSVTSIGEGAFYHCSSLTSIEIPNSVTSIGTRTFEDCIGLTSIEIPNSVTSIGDSAFGGCSGLTSIEIPESVTSIGNEAFYDCKDLDIVIDNSKDKVKFNAFQDCKSVTWNVVDESETPLKFEIISESMLRVISDDSYRKLNSVSVPAKVRIDGKIYSVTEIRNYAFSGCSRLTSIKIPNSVYFIGFRAFEGCSSLTSIEIPNSVTSIDLRAFEGCNSLTGIKISSGVSLIGEYTFAGCSRLTSIKIPNSVTYIGASAFEGCSSLNSIKIPEGVTSIGESAFDGCDNLEPKLLIYDKGTKCYGWIGNVEKCTDVVIPEGVTSIGDFAFEGCSSLNSIEIPNSVSSIGHGAFWGCGGLKPKLLVYDKGTKCYGWIGNMEEFTHISIPEGVTTINDDAFAGYDYLTNIEIPDGVTSIGSSAFAGCYNLSSIEIPESVSSIGSEAFYNCTNLDVTIDNSENNVEVGYDAFQGCRSVTWSKE